MTVKDRAGNTDRSSVESHELMMFADGELDGEREAFVADHVRDDARARAVVGTVLEIGSLVREDADLRAKEAGADDIASLVMARIEREKVVPLRAAGRRAVGIGPVAIGGLALAAAVALLVWRVAGVDWAQPVPTGRVAVGPSANPELVVASAPAPAADYDPEPGVSVDAVDFGARTGTIFYVPSDTGTTTVVWLTDDEAGGNP
jgi:anti-sigma factor RsiW